MNFDDIGIHTKKTNFDSYYSIETPNLYEVLKTSSSYKTDKINIYKFYFRYSSIW